MKYTEILVAVLAVTSTIVVSASAETTKYEVPQFDLEYKTPKTTFGKNVYTFPITILARYGETKFKSVKVEKIELLKRYTKESSKIKYYVEFMNEYCFYFNSNTPGRYSLEITTLLPNGKLAVSKTKIYVPDSKFSFAKGTKTTLKPNKNFKFSGKIIEKYGDYIPKPIGLSITDRTKTIGGAMQEYPPLGVSNVGEGWKMYSVKILKAEILEVYRKDSKKLKVKIKFYANSEYSLWANMPGEYTIQVKMLSPSGKLVDITYYNQQKVFSSDGKNIFTDSKTFFVPLNKTFKYKGETREK